MMNREIKFRGISKETGKFVYGDLIQTKRNKRDSAYSCWIKPVDILGLGVISTPTDNFISVNPDSVGEYTGLKDKNGTEVYEGDILDFDEREWGGIFEPEAVLWSNIIGRWEMCGALSDLCSYRAVIGNIYENPELLEGLNHE